MSDLFRKVLDSVALGISAGLVWGGMTATASTAAPFKGQEDRAPLVQPGPPGGESKRLTPEQSLAIGQGRFVKADVRFMQHMIIHHQQAVDMVALIEDRAQSQEVRDIGYRITLSQEGEIEFMRTWLTDRGQSVEHHGMMGMMEKRMKENPDTPMMMGMLSPNQMKALRAATGEEFDRQFLTGMIVHHQGAIMMVNDLLAIEGAGEDPALSEFLSSVVSDQSAEILRMEFILKGMGPRN